MQVKNPIAIMIYGFLIRKVSTAKNAASLSIGNIIKHVLMITSPKTSESPQPVFNQAVSIGTKHRSVAKTEPTIIPIRLLARKILFRECPDKTS